MKRLLMLCLVLLSVCAFSQTFEVTSDNPDITFKPFAEFSIKAGVNVYNGQMIGTMIANDEDAGTIFTWSIIGGNPNKAFRINKNSGTIYVNNASAVNHYKKWPYVLIIKVKDNGVPQYDDTGTATITKR